MRNKDGGKAPEYKKDENENKVLIRWKIDRALQSPAVGQSDVEPEDSLLSRQANPKEPSSH